MIALLMRLRGYRMMRSLGYAVVQILCIVAILELLQVPAGLPWWRYLAFGGALGLYGALGDERHRGRVKREEPLP